MSGNSVVWLREQREGPHLLQSVPRNNKQMPVRNIKRSRLTAAMVAVLLAPAAAFAQDTSPAPAGDTTNLDKVTVTGSLIPQTQLENFTPVTTISAEDIKTRGFTSIADALQQSAFSTGGIQGGQYTLGVRTGESDRVRTPPLMGKPNTEPSQLFQALLETNFVAGQHHVG